MSNVVFILGAGASAASGAPVMRNFLDVARDLLATGRVEGHRCHFETVFRIIGSLQQVHSKAQLDLTNIESIFTVLELARIIKRIPGVAGESEIDAAISALKVLIVKTLEMSITYPFREHSRQPLPPEPYPNFADLIRDMRDSVKVKRSASVITFNYDVSIDMAMFQAELGPSYGIFDAMGNLISSCITPSPIEHLEPRFMGLSNSEFSSIRMRELSQISIPPRPPFRLLVKNRTSVLPLCITKGWVVMASSESLWLMRSERRIGAVQPSFVRFR